MAKSKKQKKPEGGGGGAPLWMVTFGDLMSLLLTFFVLLLSFSSIQDVEFQKALGSLQASLGMLPHNQAVLEVVRSYMPGTGTNQTKEFEELSEALAELIEKEALQDMVEIEIGEFGILIRINSFVLFNSGEATLKKIGRPILEVIAKTATSSDNIFRIEGHTDNLPIRTRQFPSNWELSTGRALSVLRFFQDVSGIPPERLSAAGYSQYHPLAPNNSEKNRSRNRRVEIYIESGSRFSGPKE